MSYPYLPELANRLFPAQSGIRTHLSPEDIRDRLETLGNRDEEAAHTIADQLMRDALQAIADGHPNPAQLAQAVLTVESADFSRWMA